MKNLQDKVAVVTGAGSGIGRATARALAARGAVVAVCDLDEASAKETAQAITDAGGRASIHRVDVSSEEQVRQLVDEVVNEHSVVDIVVNNAGIAAAAAGATELSLDAFRRMMDVNFWGMVYGSLFFLPELLRRPEANLVNVSSNAGLIAYSRMAPYSASKFAVRGFTESLRMELRKSPVKVTVVCPGSTHTSLIGHSPLIGETDRQTMQRSIDRLWGRPPETVAKAIVNAVLKNRPRCLAGPDTAVLDAIVRLFPGSHSKLLAPGIEKFLDMTITLKR